VQIEINAIAEFASPDVALHTCTLILEIDAPRVLESAGTTSAESL